jgi:Cu(I)/Ag(I) efflux system protein CusF
MKRSGSLVVALAVVAAVSATAQTKPDGMQGMDMKGMGPSAAASSAARHRGVGVVKKIDAKAGSVTIAHEAVQTLNWPAMTMGFQVKDKAVLSKFEVGKKVDFYFEASGSGRYVVTSVR